MSIKDRANKLREMNDYIIEIGDEDIYEEWIMYGVPDEADDEMYNELAGDWSLYTEINEYFNRLVKEVE